jgi:hypothetical protein
MQVLGGLVEHTVAEVAVCARREEELRRLRRYLCCLSGPA